VPDYDIEFSEVLLYHIRLLEDLGEHADALALLDTHAKSRAIVDRTAVMEFRGPCRIPSPHTRRSHSRSCSARLLSKSGQTDDADHAWRALVQMNSENRAYYRGLLALHGVDLGNSLSTVHVYTTHRRLCVDALTDETRPKALETLNALADELPKASAPRRLELDVAQGASRSPSLNLLAH
jgi:hypothetical protein